LVFQRKLTGCITELILGANWFETDVDHQRECGARQTVLVDVLTVVEADEVLRHVFGLAAKLPTGLPTGRVAIDMRYEQVIKEMMQVGSFHRWSLRVAASVCVPVLLSVYFPAAAFDILCISFLALQRRYIRLLRPLSFEPAISHFTQQLRLMLIIQQLLIAHENALDADYTAIALDADYTTIADRTRECARC
jgi:hypothetical protein